MRRSERGSTLVIATIVTVVIAVIGIGLLRYSTREVAGAAAGQRAEALSTCADAARQLLLSQFHVLGKNPTQLDILSERLDGPTGRFRALGGHMDGDPSGPPTVTVKQVTPMPKSMFAQTQMDMDMTNRLGGVAGVGGVGGAGGGGTALRIVVHCQEGDLTTPTSGRQLEIEFGVRFGL